MYIIEQLFRSDIDSVEISIDYPWPYKEYALLKYILHELKEKEIEINIHAPWRDLPLATPYEDLRKTIVRTIYESISYLKDMISTYIVLHPSTMQKIEIGNNRRDSLESLRKSLIEMKKLFDNNFLLLIENLNRGIAGDINGLVETIIDQEIGFCLDIGHLATYYMNYISSSGYYDTFYDYLGEIIDLFLDTNVKVYVIHLHDVDTDKREHLLLGEGFLDFKEIYKMINRLKPRYIVYEVFRDKRGNRMNFNKLLEKIGVYGSWAKIYIH